MREAFERWATESFGGDIGDRLDRDSHFPDDYKYSDVHMAWKAWQAGQESADTNVECPKCHALIMG